MLQTLIPRDGILECCSRYIRVHEVIHNVAYYKNVTGDVQAGEVSLEFDAHFTNVQM